MLSLFIQIVSAKYFSTSPCPHICGSVQSRLNYAPLLHFRLEVVCRRGGGGGGGVLAVLQDPKCDGDVES